MVTGIDTSQMQDIQLLGNDRTAASAHMSPVFYHGVYNTASSTIELHKF